MTNIQRFKLLRIALVLCGATIVLICASISFGETFALQPASNDQSKLDPPRGNRLTSVAQLNTPGIDGLTIRYRTNWPLKFIDDSRNRVKQAGDRWTLLVCSGDTAYPTWESNIVAWERLIAELGAKYAADLSLWGVHCSGCTPKGTSEELHWSEITPAIEAANKRLIAAWARAFPGKRLLFAIGNKDDAGMKRLIQYAVARAPGRVVVKSNAMKPKASITANHIQLLIWAAKNGADIGFEPNQPSNHPKFDGTWSQFIAKTNEIERLSGKPFIYRATYPIDIAKAGGLK